MIILKFLLISYVQNDPCIVKNFEVYMLIMDTVRNVAQYFWVLWDTRLGHEAVLFFFWEKPELTLLCIL